MKAKVDRRGLQPYGEMPQGAPYPGVNPGACPGGAHYDDDGGIDIGWLRLFFRRRFTLNATTVDTRAFGFDAETGVFGADAATLETEMRVVRSPDVAYAVIDRLRLERCMALQMAEAENAGTTLAPALQPFARLFELVPTDIQVATGLGSEVIQLEVTDTAAEARRMAFDYLEAGLTVRQSGRSRVFQVGFTAESPAEASRVANAMAEAYVDQQLARKVGGTTGASSYLESRLTELEEEVRTAEQAIEAYRAGNRLMEMSGRSLSEQELSHLSNELINVRAQREDTQGRLAYIRGLRERGGDAKRNFYNTFLLRFPETREQRQVIEADARTIARVETPNRPSSPGVPLFAAVGFVAAGMFGVLLGLLRERLDRGIRTIHPRGRSPARRRLPWPGAVPRAHRQKQAAAAHLPPGGAALGLCRGDPLGRHLTAHEQCRRPIPDDSVGQRREIDERTGRRHLPACPLAGNLRRQVAKRGEGARLRRRPRRRRRLEPGRHETPGAMRLRLRRLLLQKLSGILRGLSCRAHSALQPQRSAPPADPSERRRSLVCVAVKSDLPDVRSALTDPSRFGGERRWAGETLAERPVARAPTLPPIPKRSPSFALQSTRKTRRKS